MGKVQKDMKQCSGNRGPGKKGSGGLGSDLKSSVNRESENKGQETRVRRKGQIIVNQVSGLWEPIGSDWRRS
jgi:hypothetical protein